MSKNYRDVLKKGYASQAVLFIERTEVCSNRHRRKINRMRYQMHASAKDSARKHNTPVRAFLAFYGRSAKLVSSRRFTDLHQGNLHY